MMLIKLKHRPRFCLFLPTLFWALIFSLNISAQIQVNLRPINPFHFTPEHSWEMDVISMNEKNFRVKLLAQVLTKNHHLIADLESDVLVINKGMNSFNSLTTQTQRINFSIVDYGHLISTIGKFPSGEYVVCVKFQCLTPDCDGAGSDALSLEPNLCRDVNVELPTPLILASPFDKSEIEDKRPMFTWIPPMPIGGMLELRYLYTLAERREGQSNIDAIRRNRPIIQDQFVERPSLFYPLDVDELEYEKDYVWQVEAWYGNVYIATSEVWEFKLKIEEEKIDTFRYIKLDLKQSVEFYSVKSNGVLGFTIEDKFKNTIEKIELLNDLNKVVNSDIIPVKTEISRPGEDSMSLSSYGENKYCINLSELEVEQGKYYTLKVTLSNQKGYYTRIYIL